MSEQDENQIEKIHQRIDEFLKQDFHYKQEQQKMFKAMNEQNDRIEKKIQPIVEIFDTSTRVARMSIFIAKLIAGLFGFVSLMLGIALAIRELFGKK